MKMGGTAVDAEYTDFYALLRQLGLRATHTSFYYTAYGMNLVLEAPERAEKIRACLVSR